VALARFLQEAFYSQKVHFLVLKVQDEKLVILLVSILRVFAEDGLSRDPNS